ncbi:MAG: galactose-1-phosphate uridylyltransferase, partial [Candidatus Micrarchaeota archaeon]
MPEDRNEFRKDFLLNRWVIIAANRGKRPEDYIHSERSEKKEGTCFFCPGSEHLTPPEISRREVDGKWVIRNFPNKFYAVSLDFPNAYGTHEVIVESNNHDHHLSDIPESQMKLLLEVYAERIE